MDYLIHRAHAGLDNVIEGTINGVEREEHLASVVYHNSQIYFINTQVGRY